MQVKYTQGLPKGQAAIILKPGQPLPAGKFVKAWKLEGHGPNAIQLIYQEGEADGAVESS